MNTIEKTGTQAGHVCEGAFALALGDPTGATRVAMGAVALAAIATGVRGQSSDRLRRKVQRGPMAALKHLACVERLNLDRPALLLGIDAAALSRANLVAATREGDEGGAMTSLLFDCDPSTQTTRRRGKPCGSSSAQGWRPAIETDRFGRKCLNCALWAFGERCSTFTGRCRAHPIWRTWKPR